MGRLAVLLVPLLLFAAPARAERLLFDHRIYPEIGAVLDSGRKEMIHFDDSNPAYVFNRIAIQGTSAENWTEALEIVVRQPSRQVKSPADWLERLRGQAGDACPAAFTPIAEDARSLTFMRRAEPCASTPEEMTLYRIVAGRRSLFTLAARHKGAMDEARRQQWLRLLASARIEP